MEQGMNLSGQLADWSMDDLIQIVQVTKKSGSLDIRGTTKGRVHFRDGRLTGAELHGPRGVYAGTDLETVADIIFVLGGLQAGTFAMGPTDGPETEGHDPEVISSAVGELRSLETELAASGLLDAEEIKFVEEIEGKLAFTPADWRLMSTLIPDLPLSDLEDRFGRGSAIRMLHSFQALGLLAIPEPATDSDEEAAPTTAAEGEDEVKGEEDWLDKLADRVSRGESAEWEDGSDIDVEIAISAAASSADAVKGVAADPSTTLTGGVYDDIRRLRSKSG
jgi:hypothetical protein